MFEIFTEVCFPFFTNAPSLKDFVYSVAKSLTRIVTNQGEYLWWSSLPKTITSIIMQGAVNSDNMTTLDMSEFPALEVFKVSHDCFKTVARVFIRQMPHLREFTVGDNSFGVEGEKLIITGNPCLELIKILGGFRCYDIIQIEGNEKE